MMKRLLAVSVFALFIFSAQISVQGASEAETLKVNYYRFDEDYSVFNSLWLWPSEPEEGDGNRYEFNNETDFGIQLELDLEDTNLESSSEIGVIVRGDDWDDGRDVNQDLFIDLSEPDANGVVEVYMVQSDPNVYYDEDDADRSHRIMHASFSDEETISFRATAQLDDDDLNVTADDEDVAIADMDLDGYEGEVVIDEEVDLAKTYRLVADFGGDDGVSERVIGFDGIYDSEAFNEQYAYDGELGALHSTDSTEFKLWAPIADSVELNLFAEGHEASETDYDGNAGVDDPYETHDMEYQGQGVWSIEIDGDMHGEYYTFEVDNGDGPVEVTDPYSYATGLNGQRSMVVDFDRLNPEGWEYGTSPHQFDTYNEAVLYELHTRDLTSHETWDGPEEYRGKFLGLIEEGTEYEGVSTGLDHIKELGATHVHLLPVMDFGMVDETRLDDPDYHGIYDGIFNWGYMPRHYNSLEGSYTTDPYDGAAGVEEFKQMVQGFHDNDLGVVMDVVYNHTGESAESNFHQILPGYYHRMNEDGTFSNGSGTGNETASERAMFRNFMVDSISFFVEEYNIDGFRFDLMSLHDYETMNKVVEEVHEIDDSVIFYGEPWTGGDTPLSDDEAVNKQNLDQTPDIAVFNDDSRDGIAQGHWADHDTLGFVQGDDDQAADAQLGITGGVDIPGLSFNDPWAHHPSQTVNYVSAHDDLTLHDKLAYTTDADMDDPDDMETVARMQKQSNSIVLTSQGIPFLHAGVEMMRTKPIVDPEMQYPDYIDSLDFPFDPNSYRSPDETNQIDWNWKVDNYDVFEYHRNLIHMRRQLDQFSMADADEVADTVRLMSPGDGMLAYALEAEDSQWPTTLIVHNNGGDSRTFDMPGGPWNLVATTDDIGDMDDDNVLSTLQTIEGGSQIDMEPNDTYIMYSDYEIDVFADPARYDDLDDTSNIGWIIGGIGAVIVAGAGVGVAIYMKRSA